MPTNVIDTNDYRDFRVIFTQKKWREKCKIHPELRSNVFLKNVERTIENPKWVWQNYSDKKNKRCYYRKYSIYSYLKVVIWVKSSPCHVVTAFEIDYIKEENYPKLRRLR